MLFWLFSIFLSEFYKVKQQFLWHFLDFFTTTFGTFKLWILLITKRFWKSDLNGLSYGIQKWNQYIGEKMAAILFLDHLKTKLFILILNRDRIPNYSGDLKSGLVWISNGWKEVELQKVRILNGIWNLAQPFKIWTNCCHFVKTIWNLYLNVQIMNGLVSDRLGLQWGSAIRLFEIRKH